MFKLGKKPRKGDPRNLLLSTYINARLPAPPPAWMNWSGIVSDWSPMGNDELGDCTCAAAGHMVQQWSACNGSEVVLPTDAVVEFYRRFSPSPNDNGAAMIDVLNAWRTTGFANQQISAFAQLELMNATEIMDSVYMFGAAYIGLALPDFAVPHGSGDPSIPWIVPASGAVAEAAPNINNGHCVPVIGYDERGLIVITWGRAKRMSWQFYTTYMDEAYAVLSPIWLRDGVAPQGFNIGELQDDLAALSDVASASSLTPSRELRRLREENEYLRDTLAKAGVSVETAGAPRNLRTREGPDSR